MININLMYVESFPDSKFKHSVIIKLYYYETIITFWVTGLLYYDKITGALQKFETSPPILILTRIVFNNKLYNITDMDIVKKFIFL